MLKNNQRQPNPLRTLAYAAVLATGLHAGNTWALALGSLSVQSALGEPLRAEINVTRFTEAEAQSLQAGIASSAIFQASGIDFDPALSDVKVQLQRRPKGQAVLVLQSSRPMDTQKINVVIETT